jgi:three-Cys-motif partner protein
MSTEEFFEQTSEQSLVKATIVTKYFHAWARVIKPWAKQSGGKLAYVDLFAGPGRYRDGTKTTPLLILEQAINDPELCEMLMAVFNDKNPEYCRALEEAVAGLPGVGKLKHKPRVLNAEVGQEIAKVLESGHLAPTLFFIDPWGYKGLTLHLVNAAIKDWGCDCVFFFNFNRINMGLNNPYVEEHMNALFGVERADELRRALAPLPPERRELTIVEELCRALGAAQGRFVLPFRFRDDRGTRTSHHLIFVSKNVRGYEIMKEVMARESSLSQQGVPSFEYNPADKRFPLLFELARPLDDLVEMLLTDFEGRTLTVGKIYTEHNVGRPYIERNYKDGLRRLEAEGRARADPPAEKRKKGTLADHVLITFPKVRR